MISQDVALETLVIVVWQPIPALFAPVLAVVRVPKLMLAVVVCPHGHTVAFIDLGGTLSATFLVPMSTLACLPLCRDDRSEILSGNFDHQVVVLLVR